MDLQILKPGHRIWTRDGREAEVLSEPSDGKVRIAYLGSGPYGVTKRTGEEVALEAGEIEALTGALPPVGWQERVDVVLDYFPESPDGPTEYRAATLSGVPNGVKVEGGGESGRAALDLLLDGLWLMGFWGTLEISDGSGKTFRRYEIDILEEPRREH